MQNIKDIKQYSPNSLLAFRSKYNDRIQLAPKNHNQNNQEIPLSQSANLKPSHYAPLRFTKVRSFMHSNAQTYEQLKNPLKTTQQFSRQQLTKDKENKKYIDQSFESCKTYNPQHLTYAYYSPKPQHYLITQSKIKQPSLIKSVEPYIPNATSRQISKQNCKQERVLSQNNQKINTEQSMVGRSLVVNKSNIINSYYRLASKTQRHFHDMPANSTSICLSSSKVENESGSKANAQLQKCTEQLNKKNQQLKKYEIDIKQLNKKYAQLREQYDKYIMRNEQKIKELNKEIKKSEQKTQIQNKILNQKNQYITQLSINNQILLSENSFITLQLKQFHSQYYSYNAKEGFKEKRKQKCKDCSKRHKKNKNVLLITNSLKEQSEYNQASQMEQLSDQNQQLESSTKSTQAAASKKSKAAKQMKQKISLLNKNIIQLKGRLSTYEQLFNATNNQIMEEKMMRLNMKYSLA